MVEPIELDAVLACAVDPAPGRLPIGRWIGLAAAVTVAAGLGWWAVRSSTRVPTDPAVSGTTAGSQVRTLAVRTATGVAYRQAAPPVVAPTGAAPGWDPAGVNTTIAPASLWASPSPSAPRRHPAPDPRVAGVGDGSHSVQSPA